MATIESEHERAIAILQTQLQTSEQDIEQLKTAIELLQQTHRDNEKLISNSDSSDIGIKNDPSRNNTLAWSDHERQQGEVIICSILFLVYLFSPLVFLTF